MNEGILFGIFLILFSIAVLKFIVIDCKEPFLIWWPISMLAIGCKIILIARGLV